MLKWCRLTRLGLKSLLGTLWAMRPECFRGNWDHQARPVSYDMSTSSGICHHNTDYRADTRITHWENNIQTAQPGRPTVFIVLHRQIIQEMSDLWWGTWDFMSGVCLTTLASSQVSLRGTGEGDRGEVTSSSLSSYDLTEIFLNRMLFYSYITHSHSELGQHFLSYLKDYQNKYRNWR